VPLAPREAYYPPGRYSNDYWRRVNPRIEPGRVPRPNDPVPQFRYEREHGGLFNASHPVTRPLPVVEPRMPMRSGPDRPGGIAGGRPDGRNDNRNDGRWDGRPGGTAPGAVRPIAVPDSPQTPTQQPGRGHDTRPIQPAPIGVPTPVPSGVRPVTAAPENGRDERSPRDERWQPQRQWRDDGNEPGRRDDGRFGVPVQNRPEPRNDTPRNEPWRGDGRSDGRGEGRGQPARESMRDAIREPIRENREPPRMEAPRPVMAPPQPQMQPPPQMQPQPQPQAPRVEPPRRENGIRPMAAPPQAAQPARPAAEPMRQRGDERRQNER
jgi:hypothetical protein